MKIQNKYLYILPIAVIVLSVMCFGDEQSEEGQLSNQQSDVQAMKDLSPERPTIVKQKLPKKEISVASKIVPRKSEIAIDTNQADIAESQNVEPLSDEPEIIFGQNISEDSKVFKVKYETRKVPIFETRRINSVSVADINHFTPDKVVNKIKN